MATRTFIEPQGKLTPEVLIIVLGLVDLYPTLATVESWTPIELLIAYDWAMRVHLRAGDNMSVRARPCPSFVKSLPTSPPVATGCP